MARKKDADKAPKADKATEVAVEVPQADPKPALKADEVVPQKSGKKRPAPGSVPLRTFVAAGKIKPDQMFPFAGYARRTKLGPLTMSEWHDEFQKFQKRPI